VTRSDGLSAPCYLAAVRKLPALVAIACSSAAFAVAAPAFADSSAWVFVGAGALGWKQEQNLTYTTSPTMVVDGGVGTSPDGRVIFGGLFRFQPVFGNGNGIDMSILTRLCTHGFQSGAWGVAVDLGGFGRYWGNRSVGFSGSISLGMPLGFTLMIQTEAGIDHAFSFGAVAGIDLLRLTLYRQTLLNWWQNPSPAWKNEKTVAPTADSGAAFHF
jgi:hypothetical protein